MPNNGNTSLQEWDLSYCFSSLDTGFFRGTIFSFRSIVVKFFMGPQLLILESKLNRKREFLVRRIKVKLLIYLSLADKTVVSLLNFRVYRPILIINFPHKMINKYN